MSRIPQLGIAALGSIAVLASPAAQAQSVKQVVKPPISQAWIDVATFSGFGFGGMMGPGGMNATLGALMGGGKNASAEFGYTQTGSTGRWMDVTLYTSRNTNLQQALQSVPESTGLAPTLKLETPEKPKPAPRVDDEGPVEMNAEPPKGKLVMYWGCSETVRPGQPKVVNLETATIAELGKFFESRHATQRGAHATAGRPIWPSKTDKRTFPAGASIAGQHAYSGEGVPESFKFSIPAAQDIMPEIKLRQTEQPTFVQLEWNAIPTARAYFLGSMGSAAERRRDGHGDLDLERAAGQRHGPVRLPDQRRGGQVAQRESTAAAHDDEVRDPEGGRGAGHAARNRIRHANSTWRTRRDRATPRSRGSRSGTSSCASSR